MKMRLQTGTVLGCVACLSAAAALACALGLGAVRDARADEKPAADPQLERAREQVRMLDDLYKNAVVSITKNYVERQESKPAIMIAKEVFGAMKKQGWHSARLVDATGDPMNHENAPKTDFEKAAFKAMNSGKTYYEEVRGTGPNRTLFAATVVPVVMQKCADCHSDKKIGELLGFLRYEVPVK